MDINSPEFLEKMKKDIANHFGKPVDMNPGERILAFLNLEVNEAGKYKWIEEAEKGIKY